MGRHYIARHQTRGRIRGTASTTMYVVVGLSVIVALAIYGLAGYGVYKLIKKI